MKKVVPIGCLVFLSCFLVRWLVIALAHDAFQTDPDGYRLLASELKTTGVFGADSKPTAFRPPLYPWILSFTVMENKSLNLTLVQLIHATLGATTCLLTFGLAKSLGKLLVPTPNESRASPNGSEPKQSMIENLTQQAGPILAAWLVALDPILIRQSQLIMTETLATCLSALTLSLMLVAGKNPTPKKLLWVGLSIGLSILCRPTALVWGAFFMGAYWSKQILYSPRSTLRFRLLAINTISFLAGVMVFVLPWAIRNQIEFGRFLFTTSHGGYTLLLANNDSLYDHLEKTINRNWDDSEFQANWSMTIQGLSELEQDSKANSMAWDAIQSRPYLFVKSCFVRLGWLWAPWPNQSNWVARVSIGVWYSLTFVAAAAGLARLSTKKQRSVFHPFLSPVVCLILSLSLVHAIYWSNLRMRSVAMPALYVLAIASVGLRKHET